MLLDKEQVQKSLLVNELLLDKKVGADELKDLVRILRTYCGYAQVPTNVLLESSTHLGSLTKVTSEDIKLFAWRLAANKEELIAGKSIIPWISQAYSEWMAMQVVDYRVLKNSKGVIVCEYTFRVLTGTAAGMVVTKRLSRKACRMLARQIGFPGNKKTNSKVKRYKEFGDLVGCRLLGLFDEEHSVNGPGFWHMSCTGGMKTYNRNLLKKRTRKFGFECPFDYTHPCNRCPIGYDSCEAATHPRTYILEHCDVCQEDNWFDMKLNRDMCVTCATKHILRGSS